MKFGKIESIRRIRRKTKVYNFDVPEYETYIANGFVVHNCQNFKVSQQNSGSHKHLEPQELINLACEKRVTGIVFTYNEPTIHRDYICDVGAIKGDLKIVLKTNGFATDQTWEMLCPFVDAYNVDIKLEHLRICLHSIQLLSTISHVEVSYPVDKDHVFSEHVNGLLRDSLPNVPLHLLYLYPAYLSHEAYDPKDLCRLRDFFRERLNHVYISNLHEISFLPFRHTYCPSCEAVMVDRGGATRVLKSDCCGISVISKGLR